MSENLSLSRKRYAGDSCIRRNDKRDRPEVSRGSLKNRIEEIEKQEITNALRECRWVMARAARKLGITERMIGYKIKKYGIRKEGGDLGRLSVNSY